MDRFSYTSTIDAEPLHRYKKGGYHPIKLGSSLQDGRYKILHKLGWGGHSTVWAVRDRSANIYVAIKICTAESEAEDDGERREKRVLRTIADTQPSSSNIVRMLDGFYVQGPNGRHQCFVMELLGPNVPDAINTFYPDGRLPGLLAKSIAKQALSGLVSLHRQKIGHGDLHTRNLALSSPSLNEMSETGFMNSLGKLEIGRVQAPEWADLDSTIPGHIVRPATFRKSTWQPSNQIKIIDLGESFLCTAIPRTLNTPLSVRAPEVVFGDQLDYHVDLWSMGCMLFELFVGQPPFDTMLITPKSLVSQMMESASDDLPERWREKWVAMDGKFDSEPPGPSLQEWLEEMYLDGERKEDLAREDIARLGKIIGKLLRFDPSTRASAREVLDDPP